MTNVLTSGKMPWQNRNIILLDSAGIETPLLLDKDNTII